MSRKIPEHVYYLVSGADDPGEYTILVIDSKNKVDVVTLEEMYPDAEPINTSLTRRLAYDFPLTSRAGVQSGFFGSRGCKPSDFALAVQFAADSTASMLAKFRLEKLFSQWNLHDKVMAHWKLEIERKAWQAICADNARPVIKFHFNQTINIAEAVPQIWRMEMLQEQIYRTAPRGELSDRVQWLQMQWALENNKQRSYGVLTVSEQGVDAGFYQLPSSIRDKQIQ